MVEGGRHHASGERCDKGMGMRIISYYLSGQSKDSSFLVVRHRLVGREMTCESAQLKLAIGPLFCLVFLCPPTTNPLEWSSTQLLFFTGLLLQCSSQGFQQVLLFGRSSLHGVSFWVSLLTSSPKHASQSES